VSEPSDKPLEKPQKPLSAAETAQMSEQISSLVDAGLPLGPGLRALGEELPRGVLRDSLFRLSDALQRGESLDAAVQQQSEVIPAHLRGLVLGGLRSGRLGEILSRFTGYMGMGMDLNNKLWINLAYPVIAIALAIALALFVGLVVVGMFEKIFRDFGMALPLLTQAVLSFSLFLRSIWGVVAVVIPLGLLGWLSGRLFLSRASRRDLVSRIPVIGKVWRLISWAEFCHLLALLLESHLPLPEAVRLAGEGVENQGLNRACHEMANQIEDGASLSEAIARSRKFPKGLAGLLTWSGDRVATAEILHVSGEIYEEKARNQATFTGVIMAVFAVIAILASAFFVVVGLLMPMITLLSRLAG